MEQAVTIFNYDWCVQANHWTLRESVFTFDMTDHVKEPVWNLDFSSTSSHGKTRILPLQNELLSFKKYILILSHRLKSLDLIYSGIWTSLQSLPDRLATMFIASRGVG